MTHTLRIAGPSGELVREIESGTRLMDALSAAGAPANAPCGGKGLCGKCRVKVTGDAGPYGEPEMRLLTPAEREAGVRLACVARVVGDLRVESLDRSDGGQVMTDGVASADELDPPASIVALTLPPPTLDDQRADCERLLGALGDADVDAAVLPKLPGAVRAERTHVALFRGGRAPRVTDLSGSPLRNLGVAVDVGTTTMAAYLIDLSSGAQLATCACLNPQRRHGGDVISRADFAGTPGGLKALQSLVVGAIDDLIARMLAEANADAGDVRHVVTVGNTIMMHLLAGLPVKNIAVLPFAPVYARSFDVAAADVGLSLPGARLTLSPCIAGYVGADTIAAILACDMDTSPGLSLMIDIGTNGEIALGGAERMMCCSAAAGPAFEGAQIRCGSGATAGAIDRVRFVDGVINHTTIGGGMSRSICGSGLVDAVAGMLREGIVDETGRIDEDEAPDDYARFLFDVDNKPALSLDGRFENGVFLCQKDLREVQLAKSAIAAGIAVLMERMGATFADITQLYLAGGFGNYIDRDGAMAIGLLPRELAGRIRPVGNAAGAGARRMLISRSALSRAEAIRSRAGYVELSSCPEFQDLFVENMMF
ncbi:MAG: DUF4445 domain-containing protein [Clostridiales bacterium]|nr:DUF4445 domain-containing protein [Clostridiales bacterium]